MKSKLVVSVTLLGLLLAPNADAARIKELARVKGVRANQLWGYGLVVGLAGSGDSRQTLFTRQSVAALLKRSGIVVDPRSRTTNVAAVLVTSELPAFSTPGDRVDVSVSAIGDARSLASGVLLMTPLKGADGQVYAVAQGSLVAGGFNVESVPLARRQRNVPTTARIADGATIERGLASRFVVDDKITLSLVEADFTTAQRIALAINDKVGAPTAKADNPRVVTVSVPEASKDEPVAFLAQIEGLEVTRDVRARVVINERTGTVVVGGSVVLGAASVAHANLDVSISTALAVSQPNAFSPKGRTVVVPNTELGVGEDEDKLHAIAPTTTVDDLVKALNALGASPRDLMQVLQALERAGALTAQIEVM